MEGIDCGSQIILCEYPMHFDTYKGCSHGCRYCFAQRRRNLDDIKIDDSIKHLQGFIKGKRSVRTSWCDWKIPLHWGAMSDPFQPLEKEVGISLKALKIFADSQYPFIVSTKGRLIAESPYIDLIKKCNCVVQISMACETYDKLEQGTPSFEERLEIVRKLSPYVKRLIVRCQPYFPECKKEILENLKRFKEAGAYAVTYESIKFIKKKKGLVKYMGDWVYPESLLKEHYAQLKQECHKQGLVFLCSENRLRYMSDSSNCCLGDLEGFEGNKFTALNLLNGIQAFPTEKMKEVGTGKAFGALHQSAGNEQHLAKCSFADQMLYEYKKLKEN